MKANKTILVPAAMVILIAASWMVSAQMRSPSTTTKKTANSGHASTAFPGVDDQWMDGDSTDWIAAEKSHHEIQPHADNRSLLNPSKQGSSNVYGNYTEADLRLWEAETERLVVLGSRVFHDAELLGSTNAVSCDMCHPDASVTHPETYPKYQVQLGRAALLRDMINWCLENPCRGTPMSGDDPKMRALEAYILAQRTGAVMKYGKH